MKNTAILVFCALCLIACSHNAITGRNQLHLYSDSDVQSLAATEYSKFIGSNKVISTGASGDAALVRKVGERLTSAINRYYTEKGLTKELEGYKWEYNLVDSKEVNAWCMPGGKIVVYSGLLPVTQTETALAIVMGHEITHALAKHGNERMSQQAVQQLGGEALSVAIANKTPAAQNLFLGAYGVGTTVGAILPFSRGQETEADKYGLVFAAMAGYNPEEAISFWERMKKMSESSKKPPELLSTHPSDDNRIAKLKEFMPEAIKYYKPAGNANK